MTADWMLRWMALFKDFQELIVPTGYTEDVANGKITDLRHKVLRRAKEANCLRRMVFTKDPAIVGFGRLQIVSVSRRDATS